MVTANSLRSSRLRAGLSQRELARRARTSQSAVARYEKGQMEPRGATLARLLGACVPNPTSSAGPRSILPTLPERTEDWERRPYFFWDADLSWREFYDALHCEDEDRRRWVLARLLDSARWSDIWRFVDTGMIARDLPFLRVRNQEAWEILVGQASEVASRSSIDTTS